MTPRDLNRRLTILRRLWPTHTPVRDILAVLGRDGWRWADSTCRRYASELRLFRPKPLEPPGLGGGHEKTDDEIRAQSSAFARAGHEWLRTRGTHHA